jgi:hypothetical protein
MSERTRPKDATQDQPLGLTVHSLPSPDQLIKSQLTSVRGGRWKMMAVFLVCAAPVIASYFTYYVWRPEGRRNFGELIEPQRPLPDLVGVSLTGKQLHLTALKDQWLIISVSGGACDESCRRHLYLQRQLREAVGKDKDRVDWVWLIADEAPVPEVLLPAIASATVLRVPASGLAGWLTPASGHLLADHLYLVDPMGNLMMRFPAQVDLASASKVKHDLDRLLRASASWDQPGRPVVR